VVVRTTCHISVSLLYCLSLSPQLHHPPPTRRPLRQQHRCRLNLQWHLCIPCLSCCHHIPSYILLTTCFLTMHYTIVLLRPQLLLCRTKNHVPSPSWVPSSPPTHRPQCIAATTTASTSMPKVAGMASLLCLPQAQRELLMLDLIALCNIHIDDMCMKAWIGT
jgi:hypothetical protein